MCHDPAKSGLSAGFLFQNPLLISSRCCSKIRRLSSRTVSIAIAPDIPAHGDSGPPLGLLRKTTPPQVSAHELSAHAGFPAPLTSFMCWAARPAKMLNAKGLPFTLVVVSDFRNDQTGAS